MYIYTGSVVFSIDIDPWITSSSGHCIAQATSGSGPMLTGVVGDLCGPGMVDLTSHNGIDVESMDGIMNCL